MPLYVYAILNDDGSEGETFEILQGMSEPTLTHHPETGQPVRRLLSAPNAPRHGGTLSSGNLARHGFTQYKKAGGGKYEKTAGSGPDVISRD
jgi:predicted nucleic acid-binding Zn ribbon protein